MSGAGMSVTAVNASLSRAAEDAGFRPESFDPFRQRVPRLLDTAQRLTFEDYKAHGLGSLVDRLVAKTPNGWRVASYVFPATAAQVDAVQEVTRTIDPSATLTGLPLVNRELSDRFLPQFIRGLAVGIADRRGDRDLGVSRLVAVAAGAAPDGDRPRLGRRVAGPCRVGTGPVRAVRRRDIRRHRRRLRHPSGAALPRGAALRSRRSKSSRP